MDLFGSAARLLKNWKNPNLLAQELYTMFRSKNPTTLQGPVTITKPSGDEPYLKLGDFSTGDIVMEIQGAGGISVGDISFTGGSLSTGEDAGNTVVATGTGNTMPGVVVGLISGNDYTVTVYPDGIPAGGADVSVRQLQIHEDDEIPAGTWTIVTKNGDLYYMQVPVLVE